MASPHVAGEAGLDWSKSGLCNTADNAYIRDQIEGKGNLISGSGTYWAKGRVNANCVVSTTVSEQCDTKAPTVGSTTPRDAETGVALNNDIAVTFTEEMNPSMLGTSTVTLNQKYWYQVRKQVRGKIRRVWTYRWVPVTADVRCDEPCKMATLDPASDLAANTDYRAVVTTGAKDKVGNALAKNYSWTFTTGST